MRRDCLLLLGVLLAACTPSTAPIAPVLSTTPAFPIVSTRSQTPIPSDTPDPTGTSTLTATPTETPITTETPILRFYVFPIQPPGIAEFAEGGHPYPATDLFAPEGTKFVAVTSGVVDFVSYEDKWDPEVGDMSVSGGLCVAIIGDDGVRYYGSHLSTIASGIQAGVRVEAGQLLGLVGNSGNAITTLPHVHFGISHPTFPEDWQIRRGEVNPVPFLLAWRSGHSITPPLPTP